MGQWEYAFRAWSLGRPTTEEWPGHDRLVAAIAGDDETTSAALWDEWAEWRDNQELDYLNAMGDAGFELVSISRQWIATSATGMGYTTVYAYFKRPKAADNPPEPNPIGFRPIEPR